MAKGGSKFYAVRKGRTTGIFRTWSECQASVKGFSGAEFKSFKDNATAEQFLLPHSATANSKAKRKEPEDAPSHFEIKQQQPPSKRQKKQATSPDGDNDGSSSTAPSTASIRVHIMFDGGARGNPGVAGAGASVRIVDTTQQTAHVLHLRDYVGDHATNNVAEYRGAVTGLRVAYGHLQKQNQNDPVDVLLQGDSNLIIRQLLGTYQVKNPSLKPLCREAMRWIGKFRTDHHGSSVRIEHVYRDANGVADGNLFRQRSVCFVN